MRPLTSRHHPWIALLVGLTGIVTALLLPFAPVVATQTTVTWPAPGEPVSSATALFAPYRPTDLTASIPCSTLRGDPAVVLATGPEGDGMVVTRDSDGATLHTDDRAQPLVVPDDGPDCRVTIETSSTEPAPQVFGFRTELGPAEAAGMTVTARIDGPFATTPTLLKIALVVIQLLCAAAALFLLRADARPRRRRSLRWWRPAWWIDIAVISALCGWAVIGPLAVDDGWASMIARNYATAGNPGNYYRWWDAPEVPFAFSQQLLAPLTQVSIAPLWLRLPSTLCAIATWFVLSRGVLGAALPTAGRTVRIRLLAAVCLLVAWLPFNLGTRPEPYVALGVTAALALAWRARGLSGLGWLCLVVGLTIPMSPTGIFALAPALVFAPRLVAIVRATSETRVQLLAHLTLLGCVGAVALTVIFGDQTWDGLVIATDWHTYFGPSLPWYHEPDRYHYLLENSQQGSAAKRLPVLATIAMLPLVGLLVVRRRDRDAIGRAALRIGAVVIVSLMLLALAPSKWSYHLGAAAGLFSSFLTVAIVLVLRRSRAPDRYVAAVCATGSVVLAAAAALVFNGPNAWWLYWLYHVPWASGPIRPKGVPLNNPLLWAAVAAVITGVFVLVRARRPRVRPAQASAVGPAIVAVTAFATMLAVLFVSFAAAPVRRPAGSLAMANLDRIAGTRVCGLADDIEVLPDGETLAQAADGWFVLPRLSANTEVAVSVSELQSDAAAFEFGTAANDGVVVLGEADHTDQLASVDDPSWRTVGVDGSRIPPAANRIRIRDAVTAPRLRSVVPLTDFLATHGPVMITWPSSFLFPCVRDIATVSNGLAETPRTVIESPRPRSTEDRDPNLGGTFAGLAIFGDLREIPSRLVGHPEIDWGAVLVAGDGVARDSYQRSTTRVVVPGIGGQSHYS